MSFFKDKSEMFNHRADQAKKEGDYHWAQAKQGEGDYHYGQAQKAYNNEKLNREKAEKYKNDKNW